MYSQNSITLRNKNPINAIDMKLLLTNNHCSGDYEERVKVYKIATHYFSGDIEDRVKYIKKLHENVQD